MNITLFTPSKWQSNVINKFADSDHKFGIVSTGRQAGKSLMAQNLMLYWLLGKQNMKGSWITPIYNQAKKIFQELTSAAHDIISQQNKADLTITFINGSTLQFLSAERSDSIRGFSFHYMVIDEAAFIKEESINEAVLPTLSALGKKCLIISTPKSKNWFYNYWLKGQVENNDYISFQGISTDNPYVDQAFILEQQKSLPIDIYRQEYLAEFTDAGSDVFRNLDSVCILNHWNEPSRTKRAYCGIDTAISSDYTVCSIIDESGTVNKIIRFNGSTFEDASKTIVSELKRWNIVGGYCETNSIGQAMYELIKPHIRKIKPFTTTQDSKAKGIRRLIHDIEEGIIELPSKELMPECYNELSAYTYKISSNGKLSFSHPNGYHDDIVDSLWLANLARNELFMNKSTLHIGTQNVKSVRPKFGTPSF